ncbi:MAG TPA: response regulator transcription factor [Terriglobales bacterium]|nr:response regulator transcription factor [Terriglobales bacterium]
MAASLFKPTVPGRHEPIRLLLVDDCEAILNSLATFLSSNGDIEIVGTAGDGCTALDIARECHPGLVLMDIQMPKMEGITAATQLSAEQPEAKVILMSAHDYPDLTSVCLKAGVLGFIPKARLRQELPKFLDKIFESRVEPSAKTVSAQQ